MQRRASDIVKSSHRSSKSNTPDLQRRAFDNVKANVGKPPRVVQKESFNNMPQVSFMLLYMVTKQSLIISSSDFYTFLFYMVHIFFIN